MDKMPRWMIRKAKTALEIYRHAGRLLHADRETILASIPKAANMDLSIQIGTVSSPVETTVLLLNQPIPEGPNSGLDELVRNVVSGVEEALRAMSPEERLLITMRYISPRRLGMEEICKELSMSRTTYKRIRLAALRRIALSVGANSLDCLALDTGGLTSYSVSGKE